MPRPLIDELSARYGGQVRRVNIAGDQPRSWHAAEDADVVWIESPANPTIEVADLPTLGRNIPDKVLFVVDNTFATPLLLQRPLESGADIVLHSATKLISGHSDVLLGALVTSSDQPEHFEALDAMRRSSALRQVPWRLISRCAVCVTLPLRLAQAAQANAQTLAERLRDASERAPGAIPGTPGRPLSRGRPAHDVRLRLAGSQSILQTRERRTRCVDACASGALRPASAALRSTLERDAGAGAASCSGTGRLGAAVSRDRACEDLWADLAQALDHLEGVRVSKRSALWPERDIRAAIISAGVSSPAITAATFSTIGISILCFAASSVIDAQDLTPRQLAASTR